MTSQKNLDPERDEYLCPVTIDNVTKSYCDSPGKGKGCLVKDTCKPYVLYKRELENYEDTIIAGSSQ